MELIIIKNKNTLFLFRTVNFQKIKKEKYRFLLDNRVLAIKNMYIVKLSEFKRGLTLHHLLPTFRSIVISFNV